MRCELLLAQGLGHHCGQLPGAIAVVMCRVDLAVCRLGEQRLGLLRAELQIELAAGGVEVDDGQLELGRHRLRGVDVVLQGPAQRAVGFEETPLDRGDDDRLHLRRLQGAHMLADLVLVAGHRTAAVAQLLLVVVPVLHQHQITGLAQADDLVQAPALQRVAVALAALRQADHGGARRHEARQLLPPARVGFAALVGDGGVAEQKDQRQLVDALDLQRLQHRLPAVDLQRQPAVPVPGLLRALARRAQAHLSADEGGAAHVHAEDLGARLARGGPGALQQQAANLGAQAGVARLRAAAQCHADPVAALGQIDRKMQRALGREHGVAATWAGDRLGGGCRSLFLEAMTALGRVARRRADELLAGLDRAGAEDKAQRRSGLCRQGQRQAGQQGDEGLHGRWSPIRARFWIAARLHCAASLVLTQGASSTGRSTAGGSTWRVRSCSAP
jgi:hypothetical protein